MAVEANRRGRLRALAAGEGVREAWGVFVWTRAAVLLVAIFAAFALGPTAGGLAERNAASFDEPRYTHAIGGVGEVLFTPMARWDSVWYLRIADSGYGGSPARAAFFPLYPMLVRLLGVFGGGGPGAELVASFVISLAAFFGALVLLYRLAALELGAAVARSTLLLLAVFPAALFFGAPYSESLFLLVSVGAFYAARTGSWAWAGLCAGLASATRSAGLLLLLPLAIVWWRQSDRRLGQAAWLLLAPLAVAIYALYLGIAEGDALRFLDVQEAWLREFAGPLGGAWEGTVYAWDGVKQLLAGSSEKDYFEESGADPMRDAVTNLVLFGTLVFAVLACVGCFRRLRIEYGAYVAVALLLPLSYPVDPQPLMSLPRFVAVLFPLFMWLALWAGEHDRTDRVAAVSAIGLGLFTAQYASWHWIA
jgi:mannosyltransferase PIG-V